MTATLIHIDDLPAGLEHTCHGCSSLTHHGMCQPETLTEKRNPFCAGYAMRSGLKDPNSYYWYDPIVYITRRLKT